MSCASSGRALATVSEGVARMMESHMASAMLGWVASVQWSVGQDAGFASWDHRPQSWHGARHEIASIMCGCIRVAAPPNPADVRVDSVERDRQLAGDLGRCCGSGSTQRAGRGIVIWPRFGTVSGTTDRGICSVTCGGSAGSGEGPGWTVLVRGCPLGSRSGVQGGVVCADPAGCPGGRALGSGVG
jgi:hypothetical protein